MSWEAEESLVGQLGIDDASCVKQYPERRSTVYEHAGQIRERFRYRDFGLAVVAACFGRPAPATAEEVALPHGDQQSAALARPAEESAPTS